MRPYLFYNTYSWRDVLEKKKTKTQTLPRLCHAEFSPQLSSQDAPKNQKYPENIWFLSHGIH